jgi:hypothetical protein
MWADRFVMPAAELDGEVLAETSTHPRRSVAGRSVIIDMGVVILDVALSHTEGVAPTLSYQREGRNDKQHERRSDGPEKNVDALTLRRETEGFACVLLFLKDFVREKVFLSGRPETYEDKLPPHIFDRADERALAREQNSCFLRTYRLHRLQRVALFHTASRPAIPPRPTRATGPLRSRLARLILISCRKQ